MEKHTLIEFRGRINYETIGELIHRLKLQVPKLGIQIGIYKRVLLIMIESLENIMKHGCSHASETEALINSSVLITLKERTYSIYTTNCISNRNIPEFKKKVDYLNGLDSSQLKILYKETITNGEFSDAGGAGLGLIEIVKISGNPIDYRFEPVNDQYTLFHQTVTIDDV